MRWIVLGYFAILSLIGFISMGMDKRKAIKHQWRISEATLWSYALMGGGIGSYMGMRLFRHKTKHKLFWYGFPILAMIDVIIFVYLMVNYR